MMVGPARALGDEADARVVVRVTDEVDAMPEIEPVSEWEIAESGVRRFVVPWYAFPEGRVTAVNPAGGNRVSWPEPQRDHFVLTKAVDAHLTSVHVRFILRHATTVLLEQDIAGRSIHAVCGRLTSDPSLILAVAGETQSGKTRLVNRLIAAGLLTRIYDDDCPILGPRGTLLSLVPRRYEVEKASTARLGALVMLKDGVSGLVDTDADAAKAFLETTRVPWPTRWLPSRPRPAMPSIPAAVRVAEYAAREERTIALVIDWVRSYFD
jgi:hypothetical protein